MEPGAPPAGAFGLEVVTLEYRAPTEEAAQRGGDICALAQDAIHPTSADPVKMYHWLKKPAKEECGIKIVPLLQRVPPLSQDESSDARIGLNSIKFFADTCREINQYDPVIGIAAIENWAQVSTIYPIAPVKAAVVPEISHVSVTRTTAGSKSDISRTLAALCTAGVFAAAATVAVLAVASDVAATDAQILHANDLRRLNTIRNPLAGVNSDGLLVGE